MTCPEIDLLSSYFDGEGDQDVALPFPNDGISVDELPILVWPTRVDAEPHT